MARRLILHIGSPKCGSTYLQRVFLRNRALLAEHGVNYPEGAANHPGNAAGFANLGGPQIDMLFAQQDTVVLSHEDLFAVAGRMEATANRLKEAGVEVRVVAFLRPFSAFIFGDYSQFLKQHLDTYIAKGVAFEGRGFEQFTVDRNRAMAPAGWLRGWQRILPDTPLIVASHRDIRPVIESLIGETGVDWQVPRDQSNPSLRMCDCDALVQAINGGQESAGQIRDMLRAALRDADQPDPGKTAERVRWIEALFAKQNTEIKTAFGYDNFLRD